MKLLLYGIGQKNTDIENNIKTEHMIVGYTDSYALLDILHGKPFYKLEEISKADYDYLIITISNRKTSLNVKDMLIKEYNIPEHKIIPYSAIMETQHWKIKSKIYDFANIKGIILGNSHAAFGFLEEYLDIPFVNLAVPSQDIFYNCAMINELLDANLIGEKEIKFVVFDLYDYIMFNVDTSQLSVALWYIQSGGLLKEHNYSHNRNGSGSFTDDCRDRLGIIVDRDAKLIDAIFKKNYDGFQFSNERWFHIDVDERLAKDPLIGSPVYNVFNETIKENKNILNSFLKKIKEIYPDIKIVFTLIPRYKSMEEAQSQMVIMRHWKSSFEKYIFKLCQEYNAYFLNYKYESKISENHMFYGDIEHLNKSGAMALTSILNQDLKYRC